jgi:hypothetical protein
MLLQFGHATGRGYGSTAVCVTADGWSWKLLRLIVVHLPFLMQPLVASGVC